MKKKKSGLNNKVVSPHLVESLGFVGIRDYLSGIENKQRELDELIRFVVNDFSILPTSVMALSSEDVSSIAFILRNVLHKRAEILKAVVLKNKEAKVCELDLFQNEDIFSFHPYDAVSTDENVAAFAPVFMNLPGVSDLDFSDKIQKACSEYLKKMGRETENMTVQQAYHYYKEQEVCMSYLFKVYTQKPNV